MGNFKDFMKKNLKVILAIACGICVIAGIVVIAFLAGSCDGWLKGAFIAIGALVIVLGCLFLLFALVSGEGEKANFFLYDAKTKSNIPVEAVDFALVNKKMTFVMTTVASNASAVWTENVFSEDNEIFADGETVFVPLIAYKMLYDLCERANDEVWKNYISADRSVVEAVASALELNDDNDLGKAFKFLHENADGDYEKTEKFLADNKKYIQNKMLKYVKSNIDRF